jgi:predicted NBD/HSP70 family sugar kinase
MPRQRLGTDHLSSQAAILDIIRAAGTISRVELTQQSSFSAPTVSTVVRRLIDEGLVVEVGHGESTGGKRPTLLQLNPAARFAIGVHLDHGGITSVLSDLAGTIVARWKRPGIGSQEPPEVVERIAADIRDNLARVAVDPERVIGVGVVAPGPIFQHTRMTLTSPFMERWTDFPLASALEDAIGLPVLLDNDATAAALGEYWAGAIDVRSTFAALYMGSGLGAGIVLDGTVLRGSSSNAGEAGHICLDVDGPRCWCGARGCVEVLGGPQRVVDAARAAGLELTGADVLQDFAEIARAAGRGDAVAVEVLRDSARYVAACAQTLANVLDLDLVVLTGPAFALAGSLYLPVVQQHLDAMFFARESHSVEVLISSNAPEAAAIGACSLVLQSELSPRRPGLRAVADVTPVAAG